MTDENPVDYINTAVIPITDRYNLSTDELDQIPALLNFLRSSRNLELRIAGLPVSIHAVLGTGFSKKVYDIGTEVGRYALALPNSFDEPNTVKEKWEKVLKEPVNTTSIRKLGLRANTLCSPLPVLINGVGFLGLIMRRYEDLPYEIVDSQNKSSSTHSGLIIPADDLKVETFIPFFSPVVEDCAMLLNNRILLGSDCFSLCRDRKNAHLFLNDLGPGMTVEERELSEEEKLFHSRSYALFSMSAWSRNQFDSNFLRKHQRFFRQFNNYDDDQTSIASKLTEQIVMKLNNK